MRERVAIRDALANELHRTGPLHPAQARRCADLVLRRLEVHITALEFYRHATDDEWREDHGRRASEALLLANPVAPEKPSA